MPPQEAYTAKYDVPDARNLAFDQVMQLAAGKQFCDWDVNAQSITAGKQFCDWDIKAQSINVVVGEAVQPVVRRKCRGIDASVLFVRFATLSTLSTAVAPEHGNVNRLLRSGSHPQLDEPEAPTLDATGLRHVLHGVGLGVPNSTSVRPMLAEFGEVVGCQHRLTYAQFEMLRTALNACGGDVLAVVKTRAESVCCWRRHHNSDMEAAPEFARRERESSGYSWWCW